MDDEVFALVESPDGVRMAVNTDILWMYTTRGFEFVGHCDEDGHLIRSEQDDIEDEAVDSLRIEDD